uniref:diacylglycerol O-acyltransferase n=1 Tax=Opuntia streptacantha TaxID=393608 RepID=A0A7C9F0J4_OPUST
MEPLPQHRPLWEVHITKYPTSKAAGHLIFKLHHALGDGYSLMGALLSCLQRVDNPSLPLTFPSIRPSTTAKTTATDDAGCVSRILSPIYNTIYDYGYGVLKSTLIVDHKTPIRSGDDSVELHPVKISTLALSLDQITKIKTKLRVVSFRLLELHKLSVTASQEGTRDGERGLREKG